MIGGGGGHLLGFVPLTKGAGGIFSRKDAKGGKSALASCFLHLASDTS